MNNLQMIAGGEFLLPVRPRYLHLQLETHKGCQWAYCMKPVESLVRKFVEGHLQDAVKALQQIDAAEYR